MLTAERNILTTESSYICENFAINNMLKEWEITSEDKEFHDFNV